MEGIVEKVVIIEDHLELARMIKSLLVSRGYEVAIAGDAYQGIKLIREQNPNIILLDIMLPAGGGWSILQRLRGSPLETIPVVILTAKQIDMDMRVKGKEMNVASIISKPFVNEHLIETIGGILKG